MPRRRDTPCAGGCGALLYSGPGTLPAGDRTCRGCRRARRDQDVAEGRPAVCEGCGKDFTSRPYAGTYRWRRVCSSACGRARISETATASNKRRATARRREERIAS
ncbi:hypothetical protein GA0115245_112579 [Streptomyces sp. di188]|nr:hypothetical protein GA0115238_120080 [Streptomyces sp. di50b]SCD75778.1 hypothetical protein GA0115245_112579 [Streptomyces sp. di188]